MKSGGLLRLTRQTVGLALRILVICSIGCGPSKEFYLLNDDDVQHYNAAATAIEFTEVPGELPADQLAAFPPHMLGRHEKNEFVELTLEDAIRIAATNSRVIRDIGGRVIRTPETIPTVYDPAIQETDPQFGYQAALSAFDAQLKSSLFAQNNNRVFNNIVLGGGVSQLKQDLANYQAEISKQAATGTEMFFRNHTSYDTNNSALLSFPSAWQTDFEAEVRHPLLQGGGIDFNRIAGPDATPGNYRGVLLGRINTDISLADFEAAVVDLVFDVERAYWDLVFAYKDLDARITGRDAALRTWRDIHKKYQGGLVDKEAEALARERYYSFKAQVENSLTGVETRATVVLPVVGGVYTSERRLRQLMGLPPTGPLLIRPVSDPSSSKVVFDWTSSCEEALWQRVELRKQKWIIKRREMELVAARNFLQPRLDIVGLYRWRGFGDDLLGDDDDGGPFNSAFEDLFGGNFQESEVGVQFNIPIGTRQARAAVRNAQLQIARARALLAEQELQVSSELSAAITEADRAYHLINTNFNRLVASRQREEELEKKLGAGEAVLEFVVEAQQRAALVNSEFNRALIDYNIALANVHRARGSLLAFNNIYLNEGPWPAAAYCDAQRRTSRWRQCDIDYRFSPKTIVGGGPVPRLNEVVGRTMVRPQESPGQSSRAVSDGPAPQQGDRSLVVEASAELPAGPCGPGSPPVQMDGNVQLASGTGPPPGNPEPVDGPPRGPEPGQNGTANVDRKPVRLPSLR